MAKMRAPGVNPSVQNPSQPKATSTLEQSLVSAKLAHTPKDARKLVRDLLAALHQAGFGAAPSSTLEGRLQAELGAFQKAQGLPVTGKLDTATVQRLREMGLWPGKELGANAGSKQSPGTAPSNGPAGPDMPKLENAGRSWLDFASQRQVAGPPSMLPGPPSAGSVGTAPAHSALWQHMQAQAQAHASNARPPAAEAPQLPSMLRLLSSMGFVGTGAGKAQLQSALRQFQRSLGLPPSGRLDTETRTQLQAMQADSGPAHTPHTPSANAANPKDSKSEPAKQTQRGSEGAPEPRAGAGSGGAGGAGAGLDPSTGAYLSMGASDARGEVEDDANAPAGDEDRENRQRGHAMWDESVAEEGHYEMPPLSVQIFRALEEIQRGEGGRGAATYSWDVTFYRPGVYGRRQPAEALWHIGVTDASPFDAIWREAQEALARKLEASEPAAEALTWEQMQAALRRARVRGRPPTE